MSDLPGPVSVSDEYLAALLAEVVGLRGDLAAARGREVPSAPGQQVELIEPKPAPTRARKNTT